MVECSGKKHKALLRLGLLLALSFGALHLAQAQVKAFASFKPERVETGDTFALIVIVSGVNSTPKDVDFVSWSDVFPASNILRRDPWKRSGAQWMRQYTLIAFDSANLALPPLTVLLPVGKPLTTNELTLNVFPTRGSELSEMAPMRDIYREPVSWLDYWPWAAGVLVVLLLLIWYLRKINRKPVAPVVVQAAPQPPPVSATDIALQKLDNLHQQALWKKGQVKEHHAALSLIVREYLETQYGIAALESTTSETLQMLSTTGFSKNQAPLLQEILQKTDLVKYAQSQPPDTFHESVLEKARTLIIPVLTKPRDNSQPPIKPEKGGYQPL